MTGYCSIQVLQLESTVITLFGFLTDRACETGTIIPVCVRCVGEGILTVVHNEGCLSKSGIPSNPTLEIEFSDLKTDCSCQKVIQLFLGDRVAQRDNVPRDMSIGGLVFLH